MTVNKPAPRVRVRTLTPHFLPVLLFLCLPVRGEEPVPRSAPPGEGGAVSTAPASQVSAPEKSNLFLIISKNSEYSSVGLDYSVRWDFSDLASFRPGLKTLASGIKAISSWDITENTRLNYYGFKTNPWRVFIASEKTGPGQVSGAAGVPAGAESGLVKRAAPAYRKRLRLSVSPLVDDLKRNFEDDMRDFLLRSSLKGVSPQWEKAGNAARREFMKDVLSLGFWDAPLPVLRESRDGLEYISTRPEK